MRSQYLAKEAGVWSEVKILEIKESVIRLEIMVTHSTLFRIGLTTSGRYEVQKFNVYKTRHLQPTGGGQLNPLERDQDGTAD
jgi:hypothetical protein